MPLNAAHYGVDARDNPSTTTGVAGKRFAVGI